MSSSTTSPVIPVASRIDLSDLLAMHLCGDQGSINLEPVSFHLTKTIDTVNKTLVMTIQQVCIESYSAETDKRYPDSYHKRLTQICKDMMNRAATKLVADPELELDYEFCVTPMHGSEWVYLKYNDELTYSGSLAKLKGRMHTIRHTVSTPRESKRVRPAE